MKKVLLFTYDFPYPPVTGGKNRAYNLLKIGGNNFDFSLFSFTRGEIKKEHIEKIKEIGVSDITYFPRRKRSDVRNLKTLINANSSIFRELYYDDNIVTLLRKKIIEEKIDILHCESFYTYFYLLPEYSKLNVKLIAGSENIEIKIYDEYVKDLNFFKRLFLQSQLDKIKKEEINAFKIADVVIAVTKADALEIRKLGAQKCYVIENGIDVNEFTFKPKKSDDIKNILFVGDFSYFPNTDAVTVFYNDVFIRLDHSKYTFTIVGKNSSKLNFSSKPGVKCIDYLKDIKDAYYHADVCIFPLRFGAGTSYKILESMATGVPIISYDYKMEALDAEPNIHYLLANNKLKIIEQLERLFSDDKLRNTIIKNARKLVEERYSWEIIGKKMNEIWENI